MTVPIVHDPNAGEFFADVDGHRAVLQYHAANGLMTIVHTGVPAPLANHGIAAELTRTALEFARAQGWKVEPACSYARAYLRQHTEYSDLMSSRASAADGEHQHVDALLDEALDESFPASDVPAIGGDS
jgi:uncharacterized protein